MSAINATAPGAPLNPPPGWPAQKPPQNLVFGPVPSRRLGRSLGINNIPPKVCPYACGYCQLGRTDHLQLSRQTFYPPADILAAVRAKVAQARAAGAVINYLTFVPDGEPTLDINLGEAIELLRPLGLPVAVITNAALIEQPAVQAALRRADWVSLKVDAATEQVWRRLNRPHGALSLPHLLAGARQFAATFGGTLVTETMLVAGVNDQPAQLEATARVVAHLQPAVAYLAVPTRPPAETWAQPPVEAALNRAYQLFSRRLKRVEYLMGYEGDAFASTSSVADDLLSITAVHPMRAEAVRRLLARAGADWSVVERLLAQGQLIETDYQDHHFYLRQLPGRKG